MPVHVPWYVIAAPVAQRPAADRVRRPGSLSDIAKYAHQDGFDEIVIATVLKQALEGLTYLHQNGWLHRDVKAANLLVDGMPAL